MEIGKISVLLPVYNGEKFLKEAIDSVLKQTYRNFDCIIVNDGSTDNSEEIIKGFHDERIVYVKNEENLGLIKTLNKALSVAKGEFIARMDADDIALPQRFEMQIAAFKKNAGLVAVGTDYLFLEKGKETYSGGFHESDELKAVLLFSTCFAHPTVMMKNLFYEKGLAYNESYLHAEDYKLWTDLSSFGGFCVLERPLLKYRSHPAQVSSSGHGIQEKNSEAIRKLYLKKLGFVFTDNDLAAHELIGAKAFLRSPDQLKKIESWLLNLKTQNIKLKVFAEDAFERVIHKFWYDSCGHSSLGLAAYRSYLSSPLSENFRNSWNSTMLLAKCCIRIFK